MFIKFTLMLILTCLLAGCVSHHRNTSASILPRPNYGIDRIVENIVYTDDDWAEPLEADLFLPEGNRPHPVVLVIHGGGWTRRHRADMQGISKKLARRGFAAFNVSYRFAPAHTYPAQLLDLQQAMRWLSDHAIQYNLDITHINTWGYSSGAHLAALVAGYNHQDAFYGQSLGELPRVNAVVAGGIPSDLRKYDQSPLVSQFLGGNLKQMPALYADASPAFHVSEDDPPVFLYHGKRDDLVTPDQATDYYDALIASGIKAELYLHALWGHGTMFLFGGDAENRAIDFLNQHNL